MIFPFDPRIEHASTIPARLYNDPVYLELERERVFAHSWQLVGRAEQVAEHGQYFTAEVGNDSIVVLRDKETLRAFHNVCLHRAGPVAQGCGKRNTLQCRYHGWTYSLSGGLLRAPEMENTASFKPEEMHLRAVAIATWGPLVFANIDGKAPPLSEVFEDIPARVAGFGCETMRYVSSKQWDIACNWKVYVDNYLEGYHLPMVHPGLHKELDYDNYKVEPHRYFSVQHAPLRPVTDASGERQYDPAKAAVGEAVYVWLFPNTMLNIYLGQMQTNVVIPLSHDRTRVIFDWYTNTPPLSEEERAEWARLTCFSDTIQDDDIEICEAVQ
ncbi:MAG: SRPBCC family protein, partial [Gemmatimonadaceae bacterium]